MSLQGFQQALSDLVMSPALRSRVAENPSGSLAAYELSEREVRRLEALARHPRMKTGTLLHRSFRLSMLSNTIPRTCRALGPKGLRDLMQAYWSEAPPRTMQYTKEALRFGEFALRRLRDGSFRHELLEEVLETELALLLLGKSGAVFEAGGREVPADLAGRVPRLHEACRVVAWRHDPEAVLAALDAGRAPEGGAGATAERYLLVFATEPGRVAMKPVDLETGRALRAADGRRPVSALCAELGLPERIFAGLIADGWLV